MIIKFCWLDGRYERCTETELPSSQNWEEMVEYIRQLAMTAYRHNIAEQIPEGLVREDDKTNISI